MTKTLCFSEFWHSVESLGYELSQFSPFTCLARWRSDEENDHIVMYKTTVFEIRLKTENIDAIVHNFHMW